jgi:RNA polymerase sigma-70 factor, ECF subfamily
MSTFGHSLAQGFGSMRTIRCSDDFGDIGGICLLAEVSARRTRSQKHRTSFETTEVVVATQLVSYNANGEQTLVQAGQRGESQALNTLFHRHRNLLFHSALGITGNREDAEDALQDGLLCAFRSLKNFEGRSKFSSWLTRIVINAALMRRRSLLTRPNTTVVEPENALPIKERLVSMGMTPEQLLIRSETLERTKEYIDALAPTLRTVFVLRVVLEFTANETAEILCVPPNTVKARLWRARRTLAGRMSRVFFHGTHSPQAYLVQCVHTAADCD